MIKLLFFLCVWCYWWCCSDCSGCIGFRCNKLLCDIWWTWWHWYVFVGLLKLKKENCLKTNAVLRLYFLLLFYFDWFCSFLHSVLDSSSQMRPRIVFHIYTVKLRLANSIQTNRLKPCVKRSCIRMKNSLKNRKNKWAHKHLSILHSFNSFTVANQSIKPNVCLNLQKLVSGTTALCVLYRPTERKLVVGWVGDSKALLVSQNRVLQIVQPHKPDSEVSSITHYMTRVLLTVSI